MNNRAINIIINKPLGTYYMVYRDKDGNQVNESIERQICYNVSDFIKDCSEFGFDASPIYDLNGKIYLYRTGSLPAMLVDQAI